MSAWEHDLAVLDLGEIVIEDTEIVVATFDLTDEAIEAWQDRVAILNVEARRWRELQARLAEATAAGQL